MDLVIVFQSSLYLAVALSSITLAISEQFPFPAIVTLPLAVIAYWMVERKKVWAVDGWKSNILAGIAISALMWELQGPETYNRVIAGAHFLVYLTWIVLLQTKRIRQYWFLMALSWLQVAIASVMTDSPLFGLTLFVYLILAVWTLSLFALYQGVSDLVGERQLATASGPRQKGQRSGWGADWSSSHVPNAGLTGMSSAVESPRSLLSSVSQPTKVRNSIQHDDRERWITPRYAGGILLIAMGGFFFGIAFFLLTPRFWMGEFAVLGAPRDSSGLPLNRQTVTGFTGQVQLGDLGTILENSDPVLRVRLFRRDGEVPLSMDEFLGKYGLDAPIFRGNVLDTYEDGAWTAKDSDDSYGVVSRNRTFSSIRQEISVVSGSSTFLFTMSPFLAIRDGQQGANEAFPIRRSNSVIYRFRQRSRGPFEYWVYSPAEPLAPEDREPAFGGLLAFPRLAPQIQNMYLEVPENLSRLRAMASEIAEAIPDGEQGDESYVNAVIHRLRDSREYSYSLDASLSDTRIDPVEDFLFNRKTGHCEYFATSLALLLRSEGVPARMVTGYRGVVDLGDNVYEVQQRHAHAWVEAWVDGQWMTVDATPSARDAEARNYGRDTSFFTSLSNSASEFWNTYIVGLNQDRQEEVFLQPLRTAMESADRAGGRRGMVSFLKAVFSEFSKNPAGLFSTAGALVLFGSGVVAGAVLWLLSRVIKWVGTRVKRSGLARSGHHIPVPFFDTFLETCSRHGWIPQPSQTAREFCLDVAQNMALLALPDVIHSPVRDAGRSPTGMVPVPSAELSSVLADGPPLALEIGHLFESVRYGQQAIDATTVEQLTRRLVAWSVASLASNRRV